MPIRLNSRWRKNAILFCFVVCDWPSNDPTVINQALVVTVTNVKKKHRFKCMENLWKLIKNEKSNDHLV